MDTLSELFEDTLKDVYYAENAIIKALPKMIKAAGAKPLQVALSAHLTETEDQILRLEEVFQLLGVKPAGKECHAIKGLIVEADELISEKPDAAVLDAGLLACSQAIEHYEMARYGTLRAWADELGLGDAARLLQLTLAEEKSADAKLSVLALAKINMNADAGEQPASPSKKHADNQAPEPGKRNSGDRQKPVTSGL
jgi:ferritin-like metal-binding protein YciE